ncbi:hypothetical protein LL266_19185, partial [Vibrio anguillarum]|uniref:hypothetical protein n=1 Tax=Vibrio anguillarum TaxID=55601 RepID=UPI001D18C7A1
CDSKLTHYHPNWLIFNSDNYPARGGFDSFDLGVNDWEPNQCLEALNTISDQFGSVLPYKSFEEFDQMMCSEDSFKF